MKHHLDNYFCWRLHASPQFVDELEDAMASVVAIANIRGSFKRSGASDAVHEVDEFP